RHAGSWIGGRDSDRLSPSRGCPRRVLSSRTRSAERGGGARLSAASTRSPRRGARDLSYAAWRHPVSLYPDARSRVAALLKKRVRAPKRTRLPTVLSDAEVRAITGCIR